MTDISDLNKKVSNRGATAAGILTSDDVNRMVSATIELQQASQVSGDAPAGSIGEKVYTIEQQLEDVPTAAEFSNLSQRVYAVEQQQPGGGQGGGSQEFSDLSERIYNVEQQLEGAPTAQDFAGLAGGFEAEFSIDNGLLYLNLNNGTAGFHCSPAILDLSELQSALGDLASAE